MSELKSGKGVIFFELKRIAKAKTTAIEHSERLKKLVSNDHIKKNQHFEEPVVEETNFDDSCVHDPGLFMRALVEALADEFEDKNNWVKILLEHEIVETHTCGRCHYKIKTRFKDVIITVDSNKKSIDEMVKNKLKVEKIEGNSGYEHKCPNSEISIIKEMTVKPEVLIVQINRFKYDIKKKRVRKIKNTVKVEKNMSVDKQKYVMEATINHEGNSVETGHCIANIYSFKSISFFRCSDSVVSKKIIQKHDQIYIATYTKYEVEETDSETEKNNVKGTSENEFETMSKRKKPPSSSSKESGSDIGVPLSNIFSSLGEEEIKDNGTKNVKDEVKMTEANGKVFNKDCPPCSTTQGRCGVCGIQVIRHWT